MHPSMWIVALVRLFEGRVSYRERTKAFRVDELTRPKRVRSGDEMCNDHGNGAGTISRDVSRARDRAQGEKLMTAEQRLPLAFSYRQM